MPKKTSGVKTTEGLRRDDNFRSFFNQSPMGSAIIGLDKCFIRCNAALCDFLGYSEKELIGKTIAEVTYPEDVNLGMKETTQVAMGEIVSSTIQKRYLRKDGSLVWGEVSFSLVRDENNQPLYLLPLIQDITHRKELEDSLKLQQAAWSKLNRFSIDLSAFPSGGDIERLITKSIKEFAGAEVAIYSVYDPVERTTTVQHIDMEPGLLEKVMGLLDPKIKKIHSFVTDDLYREITTEIIGARNSLYEASFGAISRPVANAIQTLLKADRFIGIAYLAEDNLYGTSLLVMGKGKPDPPRQMLENFVFLAAASLRRKKAEEALLKQERLLSTIIENIPDQIYYKDKHCRFLLCNPAVAFNCGVNTTSEVIGKTDFDFFPNNLASQYFDDEQLIMKSGNSLVNHEEITTNKNTTDVRWNLSTKVPLKDSSGNLVGLIGINKDITDRKNAEAEIWLKNQELLKANAEKDKFYSIIAHDLRSPFNALLGLSKIMAEELPELSLDEVQKIAVTMQQSAINLYSLVENLLEWSRMQRGLTIFMPTVLVLKLEVEKSMESVLTAANKKGIKVSYDIPDDLTVYADENMFESAIRNLTFNAVKFTPRGGTITISVKSVSDNLVEVAISDTGIGMSQVILDKLFRLDEQPSRKGTDGEPSTGLGLIICRDFIEKMGGKIWAESEEGKGSTFRFTLPGGKS